MRQVAQASRPRVVYETRPVPAPEPEKLRVLYLAANAAMDLRTDVEVRGVREAIRKALHRDLVELDHWPAATPEDLIEGLSRFKPHVVHFSGHGGEGLLLFDDAIIPTEPDSDAINENEELEKAGRAVDFSSLARILDSVDHPPRLLVLNACHSLAEAGVLLPVVPVVIGMADEISDLAASAFGARFYGAIADGQSVGSALKQGSVAVDVLQLSEGWKPQLASRDGVDVGELILVSSS